MKTMKRDVTELVFILDESGSMEPLTTDTIGGFNSMLAKQKNETGNALVTMTQKSYMIGLISKKSSLSPTKSMFREDAPH